jgi:hypothetical protein
LQIQDESWEEFCKVDLCKTSVHALYNMTAGGKIEKNIDPVE